MTEEHDARDDDDLIRFLLDELDDEALCQLHDRLQGDPGERAELADLDHALHALKALRSQGAPEAATPAPSHARRTTLLGAAAVVVAFLLGMLVRSGDREATAIDVNAQAFYDSYTAQPDGRSDLGRTLVAYMNASRER